MLRDLRSALSLPIGILAALALLAASCVPPPPPPGARSYDGEAYESADEDDGCRDDEPVIAPGHLGMPPDRAPAACRRRPRSSSPDARPAAPGRATCTEVVIGLPGTITFHGDQGPVIAAVKTSLAPGKYTIGYDAGHHSLVVSVGTSRVVLYVSLKGFPSELARYQSYLASMTQPVPLRVFDAAAKGTAADRLSPAQTAALLKAAGDTGEVQRWAQLHQRLASRGALSAAVVVGVLDGFRRGQGMAKERPPSTRDAVDALASQWSALSSWERELWEAFLKKYGTKANIMPVADLHITEEMALAMALRIVPRYLKPGAREAFEALVNDPMFLGSTVIGISVYLALWVAPEPFFTKAAAVLTTIGLVSVAGFTAAEIITLAKAWMRLRDEAGRARTMRELDDAAERFGKQLGGASLRVLLTLTTLVGSKVLPANAGTAGPVAITGTSGNAAVMAAGTASNLAVATSGVLVKVQRGSVTIINTAQAMSAASGSGGKASPGSGTGSGDKATPAKAKPKFKAFTDDNFRDNLGRLTGGIPKDAHAHHVFPKKFIEDFRKAGINIHDPHYGAWWQSRMHLQTAKAYEKRWLEFLRTEPSADEILQFGRKIAKDHGLHVHF